ncbi:hypothetical protein [uncultured Methanofollis sp.]|uniref:hypothetical protein n=1 Tax=uncultured Methanofollis sp. TaxID=262500 RepID=UPI00260B6C0F|nr:hypothetical protein [uncultured Methanofollis sp.]
MKSLLLMLLLCVVVAVVVVPVQAVPERQVTTAPLPGEEFVVTLDPDGITVGGIVETIPPGFTFVSTTHPPGRVSIKGQQVSFVVLNDTAIRYLVRAPDSGGGTFTGVWEDFLNQERGVIAETPVVLGAGPGVDAGTPAATRRLPGWTALSALCALTAVAFFRRRYL